MNKGELRDIPGYVGLYTITENGDVYNKDGHRVKPCNNQRGTGYLFVRLRKDGRSKSKYVHRLIAEIFIGNTDFKVVNHINGLSTDNNIKNLEVVSQKENIHHYWNSKRNKFILCTATGIFYDSIAEAATSIGKPKQTLGNQLIGKYKNKTTLIYC